MGRVTMGMLDKAGEEANDLVIPPPGLPGAGNGAEYAPEDLIHIEIDGMPKLVLSPDLKLLAHSARTIGFMPERVRGPVTVRPASDVRGSPGGPFPADYLRQRAEAIWGELGGDDDGPHDLVTPHAGLQKIWRTTIVRLFQRGHDVSLLTTMPSEVDALPSIYSAEGHLLAMFPWGRVQNPESYVPPPPNEPWLQEYQDLVDLDENARAAEIQTAFADIGPNLKLSEMLFVRRPGDFERLIDIDGLEYWLSPWIC